MCPDDDETRDNLGDDGGPAQAEPGGDTSPPKNSVLGPLTDEELNAGGMERLTAYVRTERTREALRKEKQRTKQKDDGKRQINIVVPDNDRARATMRAAATAIEDEPAHHAIEMLLADEWMRSLVIDLTANPILREIVELAHQWATDNMLQMLRLCHQHPEIAELIKRTMATSEARRSVEAALDHPEFVSFGRVLATGQDFCVRTARMLLRLCKRRDIGGSNEATSD